MHRIRDPNDFFAGLLFMAFGVAALVLSHAYVMGEATRMGPGYFPRALGFLLLVFGGLLSLRALYGRREDPVTWRLRPLAIVLGSLVLFCIVLKWIGLVLAGAAMVVVASWASTEFRWKEALISGLIQGVMAVVVFVYGLKIPIPVWPPFALGGV